MRLIADHTTVPHGTASFLVTNSGSIGHEMVVLPLADSQTAGPRPIAGDARIDEAGSLCNLAGHYTAGMFTRLTVT